MELPLISVIIPTYNRMKLLEETLSSVKAQTYTNWECIIVDDGSTDGTAEMINSEAKNNPRIHYLKRPESLPKGASACRNYGFSFCKGQFINWFDDDDLMHPRFLEKKAAKLIDNSEAACCFSKMQPFYTENGEQFYLKETNIVFDDVFESFVLGKISLGTPNPLWRRSVLENEPVLFDETLKQSQDLELYSRLFFKHRNVMAINEILMYFRVKHASISKKFMEETHSFAPSFLEVRNRILALSPENKKLNRHIVKSVLGYFRAALAQKDYKTAEDCLNFVKNKISGATLKEKVKLFRIRFFYQIFKLIGAGSTRFKKLLKL